MFMLDTTLLELDGKLKDAEKVVPGRGKYSLAQLFISFNRLWFEAAGGIWGIGG